eukprot:9941474-Alexandrium_andersonii.AAC.1
MSASLVGSEMCIRDSPESGAGRSTPRTELRGPSAATPLRRLFAPLRVAPVSYTHLTLPTICSV